MGSDVETTGELRTQGEKSTPRRRRWYIVLMLLALTGFTIYRLYRPPEPPLAEALTPDGKHRIRVIAVGVGDLDYHPDSKLYAWLHRQWLQRTPQRFWTWIPGHRNVFRAGKPTKTGAAPLQILLEVEPVAADAPPANQVFDLLAWFCEDSNGAEFQGAMGGANSLGPHVIHALENFPRRDKRLKLRLIDGRTFSKILTFDCPNPAPLTNVKEWALQSLPATESSAVATCTLKGWKQQRGSSSDYEPDFVVEPRSPAWAHNQVSVVAYEDATGNASHSVAGGPQLSPFEPTWKVQASLYRTADAEFAADERWQSPVVEMPPENGAITVEGSAKIGSATIRSVGVKGPGWGVLAEANGRWKFSAERVPSVVSLPVRVGTMTRQQQFAVPVPWTNSPYAVVDVEGLAPEQHLIVVVRDQNGEVLEKEDRFPHRVAKTFCRAAIYFTPLKTSKQLTVTVAISRPEVFQFYVKPPEGLKKRSKIWE